MVVAAPPRRIVFSRKGLDTGCARTPSPIVGERPVSLPIPTAGYPGGRRYDELAADRVALARLARLAPDALCHLDPDIDRDALPGRPPGWRGAFGQANQAGAHRRNQGVGPGDLFLFFGLFRGAVTADDDWRWGGEPARHTLFGWLRVGAVPRDPAAGPAWLAGYPHLAPGWPRGNAIYLAAGRLDLPGAGELPGWGVFSRTASLSAPGGVASNWAVPAWLERQRMTYRSHDRCWPAPGRMNAHGQWQEGVATADDEAVAWAGAVIAAHVGGER